MLKQTFDQEEFIRRNPERYGYTNLRPKDITEPTRCLVCGGPQSHTSVFCAFHIKDWDADSGKGGETIYTWAQSHPEFNGSGIVLNPCGNCNGKIEEKGDYLCGECRLAAV